jgi:hypothetical protein
VADPLAKPDQPVTLHKAVAEYLADEEARRVGPELRKSKALLERNLWIRAKGRKLHLLKTNWAG